MLKGADVSQWQKDINFDVFNLDFLICKATEGVGYIDPKFKRNQTEARKKGLLLGYYHFARPDLRNTAESEADYFLQTVDLQSGEILFLDFEVTVKDSVRWCKAWLDRVSSKLNGYKPLIYLNQNQIKSFDWQSVIGANYGLWLAQYDYNASGAPVTTPWKVTAFRQYSNKEQVAGITGNVDGNVFYGDKKAFKKYGVVISATQPTPQTPALSDVIKDLDKTKQDVYDLQARVTKLENKNLLNWLLGGDRNA